MGFKVFGAVPKLFYDFFHEESNCEQEEVTGIVTHPEKAVRETTWAACTNWMRH